MDSHEKSITAILLIAIVIMTVAFFLHWNERKAMRQDISQIEAEFITQELHRRSAGDCALTRTDTGWTCREFRTGRRFNIKMEAINDAG